MKYLLLTYFLALLSSVLPAQDISVLSREAERLESLPDEKASLAKYKEILKIDPINIYALNKCSELCSRIGQRQPESKMIEDYYAAAKTYAAIALKVNPNNAESNCVMAIALGRTSLNRNGKEKIASAKEIKKYVDIAIKNDPNNFKAWHVLGRWHYEISSLNGFEKTAVKLFFGGLPVASFEESIIAFEKAQSITGGFVLNYFEMAKAYKKNNQKDKAIEILKKMMNLPDKTEDDPKIKQDGRKLVKEWL